MSIAIGKLIGHDGDDWAAAVRLRDTARAEILRQCGGRILGRMIQFFKPNNAELLYELPVRTWIVVPCDQGTSHCCFGCWFAHSYILHQEEPL